MSASIRASGKMSNPSTGASVTPVHYFKPRGREGALEHALVILSATISWNCVLRYE